MKLPRHIIYVVNWSIISTIRSIGTLLYYDLIRLAHIWYRSGFQLPLGPQFNQTVPLPWLGVHELVTDSAH